MAIFCKKELIKNRTPTVYKEEVVKRVYIYTQNKCHLESKKANYRKKRNRKWCIDVSRLAAGIARISLFITTSKCCDHYLSSSSASAMENEKSFVDDKMASNSLIAFIFVFPQKLSLAQYKHSCSSSCSMYKHNTYNVYSRSIFSHPYEKKNYFMEVLHNRKLSICLFNVLYLPRFLLCNYIFFYEI